jgi:hypothetical protein
LDSAGNPWVAGEESNILCKFDKTNGALAQSISIPGVVSYMGICAHPEGGFVANTYGEWPAEEGREAGIRVYRVLADGTTSWNKHISAGLASRSSQAKVAVASSGDVYVAFTAGETSSSVLPTQRVFPEVKFEGYSETFPFAPNADASKGFLAVLRFD